MKIQSIFKKLGFLTLPFLLGGATYYVNGRPVYVEDNYSQGYYYDSYSRPIIINNGPTIIINKNPNKPRPPQPPKDPNYNSGEQKLPNNGISRPGTPYFSGDGSVRNN
ncbi:hypothetical protein ACTOJ1_001542 [Shigella flexneri]